MQQCQRFRQINLSKRYFEKKLVGEIEPMLTVIAFVLIKYIESEGYRWKVKADTTCFMSLVGLSRRLEVFDNIEVSRFYKKTESELQHFQYIVD
jgi:hypothetical protein